MMRNIFLLLALTTAASIAWTVGRPDEVPFHKHEIDLGANEPCAFADINGDGKLDIVSGENWYEAPRWSKHKFRSLVSLDILHALKTCSRNVLLQIVSQSRSLR